MDQRSGLLGVKFGIQVDCSHIYMCICIYVGLCTQPLSLSSRSFGFGWTFFQPCVVPLFISLSCDRCCTTCVSNNWSVKVLITLIKLQWGNYLKKFIPIIFLCKRKWSKAFLDQAANMFISAGKASILTWVVGTDLEVASSDHSNTWKCKTKSALKVAALCNNTTWYEKPISSEILSTYADSVCYTRQKVKLILPFIYCIIFYFI